MEELFELGDMDENGALDLDEVHKCYPYEDLKLMILIICQVLAQKELFLGSGAVDPGRVLHHEL